MIRTLKLSLLTLVTLLAASIATDAAAQQRQRTFNLTADDFITGALTPATTPQPAIPQAPPASLNPGLDVIPSVPTPRNYPPPTVVRRPQPSGWNPGPATLPPLRLGIYGSCTQNGVLVEQVFRGSYAEQMGFEPGDIIVAVNGQRTNHIGDLQAALSQPMYRYVLTIRDVRTGQYFTDVLRR